MSAEPRAPGQDRTTEHAIRVVDDAEPPMVLPPPASVSSTRLIAIVVVAAVALAGAFIAAYLPSRRARAALEAGVSAASSSVPRVEVVTPTTGASTRALVLPGSIHPLEETVIYPRANGYLRRWLVDIGDHVHAGQRLAEIDTPDLDQDLAQARAQLAQAEATLQQSEASRDFAQSDLHRYAALAPAGLASQQEFEQHQATARVSTANVAVARAALGAQRAAVDRLLQLKSFANVVAPFDGTITARSVDRGALLSAGNSTPLFRVAAMDPVRVFVQVPQDVAPSIRAGVPAHVTVREFAGRSFEGQITRAAGALDPASRTMNTEIRVPNTDGALIAGMYADVALSLPVSHHVWEIPATAVMSDAHGVRVAAVDATGHVHLIPVVIEHDTGATVQIATGLRGDERLIRIANSSLTDGTQVEATLHP